MSLSDQAVINLARIADALERIATALEPEPGSTRAEGGITFYDMAGDLVHHLSKIEEEGVYVYDRTDS